MARRRNYPVPYRPARRTGFDASALQIRHAYERHYGAPLPTGMPYVDAANLMIADLGHDAARALILAEANNPDAPSPLAMPS